ncbi:MAG: SpoVR family protein [Bdellovibrionales bacterium]|nr:SpoVR family protein [Bdellovibrionales bacterium]
MADLSIELVKAKEEIEAYARDYGLDFFQTIFEVLEFDELNQVAAYGGFPTRYPHWSFGMEYEQLAKGYEYGLSKIYEMVINTDPCYAYLMKSNPLVDQKLVMAHVYGHCDFFKNNAWFANTNRKMMDEMANHGTRIRRYVDRYGFDVVESFIDTCKSLETMIDPHGEFTTNQPELQRAPSLLENQNDNDDWGETRHTVSKLKSKDYMDSYINPPEFLEEQRQKAIKKQKESMKFPQQSTKDVMGFLIEYGSLNKWQRDILSIIREEAYYFLPQGQTKIMNEGWASYWHSTMMTQKILKDSEVIDYADHHSGTLFTSPGRLNPYKLGIELFRDIEERWNKGKFGAEYEDCLDLREKRQWDKKLGLGRKKIFEVRRVYNDLMFLDEFLTPEFCIDHKLFTFGYNPKSKNYEIFSREFHKIKQGLLHALTNMGRPIIVVEDANFENRSELLLKHTHEGVDLKIDWAKDTLKNIFEIWKRPVNLLTVFSGKEKIISFNGKDHREKAFQKETKSDT